MPSAPRARRRRRRRRAIGTALVLASLVAIGIVVAGLLAPEEPGPHVLLVGDSIMKQTGQFVEEEVEALDGVDNVDVINAGENGSGLLTPRVFDWQTRAEELIDEEQPDVIVVLFIGNYTNDEFYVNEAGDIVEAYTDEFYDAWGVEADRLMDILTSDGADVYWVNPPPSPAPEGEEIVSRLRDVYQGVASRWPGTVLIDGTTALADDDGHFALRLPVPPDGELEQVRTDEGVHLTDAGSRLMAAAVAEAIAPSVRAAAQELR